MGNIEARLVRPSNGQLRANLGRVNEENLNPYVLPVGYGQNQGLNRMNNMNLAITQDEPSNRLSSGGFDDVMREDDPMVNGEGLKWPVLHLDNSEGNNNRNGDKYKNKISVGLAQQVDRGCSEIMWLFEWYLCVFGGEQWGALPGMEIGDRHMRAFSAAFEDCELEDLGYDGVWYTWEHGQFASNNIRERLDRAVANDHCLRMMAIEIGCGILNLRQFDFLKKHAKLRWHAFGMIQTNRDLIDLLFVVAGTILIQAKAVAVIHGLRFAKELGFLSIIVEEDSRSVASKINNHEQGFSDISALTWFAKEIAKEFQACAFHFIGRYGNKIAYAMAQEGLS
ncbi:hypothetical protein Golax_012039 [Gossypium laxum]|uniref:RNase H type-1 domain-containing protein n=1 Tax=Gossypium laxum TaxID=34288 RepID=A0A7J8ZNQ0_9ROSI|nr:hypothetical protein [Gossypium laxum]